MKIIDLKLKRYDLPLVKPLTINGRTISTRSGVIIFLSRDDGLIGCGETAPLEGLHGESLDDAISQLSAMKKKILLPQRSPERLKDLLSVDMFPSVRMGIEMSIFNLLRQSDNFIKLEDKAIDINGLLMPCENLLSEAQSLIDQGYSAIKIKVGRRSVQEDIKMLLILKEMLGSNTMLRLDANRLWQLDEAVTFCKAIGPAAIEYIEEPLKNIADMGDFFKETAFPVALDETIAESGLGGIKDLNAIDAFVLKPSLLGGFDKTAELVSFAKKNHKKACVSSAFESSVSIEAFAVFAGQMAIDNIPQGLDTGKWFAEDLLIDPLTISKGAINISQSPPIPANLRMDLLKDV